MSEVPNNSLAAPQFTSKTIFGTITKFEDVQDRIINTEHFLQACTDITGILDHLGTSFTLAKKDMLGNIKRINEHYKKDVAQFATLNVILEAESHMDKKPSNLALGVIWLKRALEFLRAFISGLSTEHHNRVEEENLRQTVLQAYEGTLQPYHGLMTQFLFTNISRLVPYRRNLLKTLMLDPTASVDMVISDIDLYLVNFSATLKLLEELLTQYGLTTEDKV
ncbi:unnamed protein product [Candidula unifasciata]|uniref:Glycolipid transfer protein domain-containing protein n=1 Tax=Candidula unifasciata TaxID=100452 RepID=A0A8S3ZGJ8_9EUPU|nr:unnamed protein product [Candidula unifasciata]